MNKKELKSVIKEMVRESLTEIFAEIKLESIVEKVVRKETKNIVESKSFVEEEEQPVRKRPPQQSSQDAKKVMKENMIKNIGVSENEWQSIYADVSSNDLDRVPNGSSTVMENPEFVSESDLRKLGLL